MRTLSDSNPQLPIFRPAPLAEKPLEGVAVDELPIGAAIEVATGHTTYRIENRGEGKVLISGHPTYCPEPVLVDLHGAVGGTALLKMWSIEPGLKMEFDHPIFGVIRTSRVRSVRPIEPSKVS